MYERICIKEINYLISHKLWPLGFLALIGCGGWTFPVSKQTVCWSVSFHSRTGRPWDLHAVFFLPPPRQCLVRRLTTWPRLATTQNIPSRQFYGFTAVYPFPIHRSPTFWLPARTFFWVVRLLLVHWPRQGQHWMAFPENPFTSCIPSGGGGEWQRWSKPSNTI